MTQERQKILQMLANGKISVDEASQLLEADVAPAEAAPAARAPRQVKYLRITVDTPGKERGEQLGDRVNIRVPIQLLRTGMKLTSLMPGEVGDKVKAAMAAKGLNIDLTKLSAEDLEQMIAAMADLAIDVDSEDNEKIRVFCE
jgi:hypothetical protein